VKTVTLAGNGKAFCAGADLEYLARVSGADLEANRSDSFLLAHLFRVIYELRKPVIARVHGPALAGGCGLATVCDFVIASREHALFGYPEVRIGFIPAIVMIFLLKRVSEKDAKELLLTSKFITGEEAVRIGFANHVFSQGELEAKTEEICEALNKLPQSSIALTKEMFANISSMSFETALEYAVDLNAITRMTEECRNGVSNFLTKSSK
jgi:methylglutaconyl-CoA hydratase